MFKAGENLGPYQLLEQIGEGGMGTVFKAYHPALDRYVALKIIHPAHRQDQSFVARFQREARLVARLEHPNIVPIYDYAEHDKISYLVMKFIEGHTLKDRLERHPLNFYEVLQVVDSVGSALAYAHTQGVLHRDIKPSNVLIGVNNAMYLADFGLARIAHAEASTLSSESALGTPQYVSPEQALGRNNLDRRTDIYSFGVMLYEIVVGQAPFKANGAFAIIHDHIYTPLPLPRALNPNVSEAVELVLLKALAKDPNERFDNIVQMVTAFNNAWLNTNSLTQGGVFPLPAAHMNPYGATSGMNLPALKEPESQQKKRAAWLFAIAGIIILIGLAFSLMPSLRSNLISLLTSTSIPTTFIAFTPTGQATSIGTSTVSQATLVSRETNNATNPVPNSTNTPAPRPTDRPTDKPSEPAPNLVTPIVEPIQTIVDEIIDTPPVLPPLLP